MKEFLSDGEFGWSIQLFFKFAYGAESEELASSIYCYNDPFCVVTGDRHVWRVGILRMVCLKVVVMLLAYK